MAWTDKKNKIQSRLLRWFKKNQRDLPWRKTKDPYAIWVSEIMLQQTQVKTVIPYYQTFLKSFPTIRHLAKADLSEVLKVWEGLGYYSRARNLHCTSQIVLDRFHGKIPDSMKDLLALPGIGRSTAGAICSFAFHKDAPILDGNAKRVLSRLFAISKESQLWKISESLIPEGFSNPFNQALMDLGAMVCTPKGPSCSECPVKHFCKGYRLGKPEQFPSKVGKKRIPHLKAVAAVIKKDGKVLLTRRPPKGLLGGLWEFPNWRSEGEKDLNGYLRAKVKSDFGLKVQCKELLGTFQQTYSHFNLTLQVFHCQYLNGKEKGRWVPIKNLDHPAMSRIHRRIANVISRGR